jgi:peptidoglycan glycosyltransferase
MNSTPQRTIPQLGVFLAISFLVIGAVLFYWVALQQGMLANDDNPRNVETELRIQRGQIVDTRGTVLAESIGPENRLERHYPFDNMGPAVGYYNLVHETAGIEEGLDATLRGESDDFWEAWWRDQLHTAQVGSDVRLTLEQSWQDSAETLMQGHNGALILVSLDDNAVRAMVSTPGYDPNLLEDQFDALSADPDSPLLNRATQGQYQPGMLLQPLILAGAVDTGLIALDQIVPDADETLVLESRVFDCATKPPESATWSDVLIHNCPTPMYRLGRQLAGEGVTQILDNFGLTLTPTLPIATNGPVFETIQAPGLAAIGQENLAITPLQAILAWATLAREGRLASAQLVSGIRPPDEAWTIVAGAPFGSEALQRAISAETAAQISTVLADSDGFIEHEAIALSGPAGDTTTWYMGMAPSGQPRYAVVLVLEGSDAIDVGREIGRNLLQEITTVQ